LSNFFQSQGERLIEFYEKQTKMYGLVEHFFNSTEFNVAKNKTPDALDSKDAQSV
jgi:hypothetical protein